jgi:hypothetical protein
MVRQRLQAFVERHITTGTDIHSWLSTEMQQIMVKPVTMTDYLSEVLECKQPNALAAYRERVLPPIHTDYTTRYLDADDLVLVARMLDKSVTVYRVRYGTDTQGEAEGLPMSSPQIGRSACVYHSNVGGITGDPLSILLDDTMGNGDPDNSDSSHYYGLAHKTDAVPIACAFNACPTCAGAVTEKGVLDGHWSMSHVLSEDMSDATMRLVCQPCVGYLYGANAERFVAGAGDLRAAVPRQSQHEVHEDDAVDDSHVDAQTWGKCFRDATADQNQRKNLRAPFPWLFDDVPWNFVHALKYHFALIRTLEQDWGTTPLITSDDQGTSMSSKFVYKWINVMLKAHYGDEIDAYAIGTHCLRIVGQIITKFLGAHTSVRDRIGQWSSATAVMDGAISS